MSSSTHHAADPFDESARRSLMSAADAATTATLVEGFLASRRATAVLDADAIVTLAAAAALVA